MFTPNIHSANCHRNTSAFSENEPNLHLNIVQLIQQNPDYYRNNCSGNRKIYLNTNNSIFYNKISCSYNSMNSFLNGNNSFRSDTSSFEKKNNSFFNGNNSFYNDKSPSCEGNRFSPNGNISFHKRNNSLHNKKIFDQANKKYFGVRIACISIDY